MHPYSDLPPSRFWSPVVGQVHPIDIAGLWSPRFEIRKRQKIATFGSCFAQHIGRNLTERGFSWTDWEPAHQAMSPETAKRFNFGVFSARTGNIYTARMLSQWVSWATGQTVPPNICWGKDGRFYDPFRPAIEPGGFASIEEVINSRELTIEAFAAALREASVFVFTLGLTESWRDLEGFEYAVCPGMVAGTYDGKRHKFHNALASEVTNDLKGTFQKMRHVNSKIRFLLTVSPVPLTATGSGDHVLVATMRSKAVLRAAVAEVTDVLRAADYFPSFEIITAPPFAGRFYELNQRSVRPEGVAFVMDQFFAAQSDVEAERGARSPNPDRNLERRTMASPLAARRKLRQSRANTAQATDDLVCEEVLLDAFAQGTAGA